MAEVVTMDIVIVSVFLAFLSGAKTQKVWIDFSDRVQYTSMRTLSFIYYLFIAFVFFYT